MQTGESATVFRRLGREKAVSSFPRHWCEPGGVLTAGYGLDGRLHGGIDPELGGEFRLNLRCDAMLIQAAECRYFRALLLNDWS